MHASLEDVLAIARELLAPTILAGETLAEMTSLQFPGLVGVLPDYGRFEPLDWGLGVQLNTRPPSWMGTKASERAFGHFGGSGTFVWVDPERQVACAALTDREFGDWAKEAWPALSDAVLEELAREARPGLVVREQRAHELVERRRVAARHDAGRHRGHCRRARDVHRERDLPEELAGAEDAALAERGLRYAGDPREEHVEAVAGVALAHDHGSGCDFVALHPVGELREGLAGQRPEQADARELRHGRGDVPRRHGVTVPGWAL